MKREIAPSDTPKAAAFDLWMSSPMPMVTLTKTFDVSRLVKVGKKRGWKFNMLLCWAIGCAASRMKDFYLLPEKQDGVWKLMKYDSIAINVIVNNAKN